MRDIALLYVSYIILFPGNLLTGKREGRQEAALPFGG